MSFQQGLSGLNAASKQLDTIGNNVANSSTVGYKSGQTIFADVYASSLTGSGASQVGIGVKVAAVAQQFTQGNITSSNNPLDIAINGGGFFRMSDGGTITYARNGQFTLDKDGYIVNASGSRLTGYMADTVGVLSTGSAVDIQINTADLAPVSTDEISAVLNLDSTKAAIPAATVFSTSDPTSYNNGTSVEVYDSLGNAHVVQTFYRKTAANTWDVYASVDGKSFTGTAGGSTLLGTLGFTSGGALTGVPAMPLTLPTITAATLASGAANLDMKLDYSGTTQFGSAFGVTTLKQDGYTSGRLSGFAIDANGILTGRYTNGRSNTLAQIVLANFTNPNGLQPLGNNVWAETSTSGAALVGTPDSGTMGVLQQSAVEDSNVDLTAELVNMITAQRYYQANAQTIKAQDEIMQTLVNLR